MKSLAFHVIITRNLPRNDHKRFSRATPRQAFSAMMSRCWQIAPTSASIVQDLSRLEDVVMKIIAAKGGGIVDDIDFRTTGKRSTARKDGKGVLKSRFRRRHQHKH